LTIFGFSSKIIGLMSLTPEFRRMPQVINLFYESGLMFEYFKGCLFERYNQPRDLTADAWRIINSRKNMEIHGHENLNLPGGGLAIINHPKIDILIPALFLLAYELKTVHEKDIVFTMGEAAYAGRLIPAVTKLTGRFMDFYPRNIIPIPTAKRERDYQERRAIARERIIQELLNSNIVVLSPEARVEEGGVILPTQTYRFGAGGLAKEATKISIPQIPVAIWEADREVKISLGKSFYIDDGLNDCDASIVLMRHVAECLPRNLRGPFESDINQS